MKGARCPGVIVLVLALVMIGGAVRYTPSEGRTYPAPVPLGIAGLIGDGDGSVAAVAPGKAAGASYLPASNVLRLANGRLLYLPPGSSEPITVPPDDPGAMASAEEARAWLSRGEIPGESGAEREISARILLDLRLLTLPNGAALAARNPGWDRVWPRDASWMAAAFAATGHHEESYRVLEFLARAQEPDGTWEARYHADGSPVLDGRSSQLDANGWFLWAVWFHSATAPHREDDAHRLWPAVREAANAAAASLGPGGLPPGGADYWEISTWRPNLGTAAPLQTGLRAAADLAGKLGHRADARRYAEAAARLDAAVKREFAPHGYPRTTRPGSGADSAVNFLAPPFAPSDPSVAAAVREAEARLSAPNGGILPGERWPQDPSVAWTPETAFFMLSAAASGDKGKADRWLAWLAAHRTSLGAFPEKVDGEGKPRAAAPLGWTEAIVLLALAAGEDPLPAPPVPTATR